MLFNQLGKMGHCVYIISPLCLYFPFRLAVYISKHVCGMRELREECLSKEPYGLWGPLGIEGGGEDKGVSGSNDFHELHCT